MNEAPPLFRIQPGFQRLPLSVLGALVIACYIFFTPAPNMYLMVVAFIIALLSYVVPYRFQVNTLVPLVLYVLIALFVQTVSANVEFNFPFGQNRFFYIIGQATALISALWFWLLPHRGGVAYSTLYAIGGATATMVMACNTSEEGQLRYLIPLYFLAFLISLRDYRAHAKETLRSSSLYLRIGAMTAVFALGITLVTTFTRFKPQLTEMAGNLLTGRATLDMGGMSSQPTLNSAFGLKGGSNRVLRLTGYTEGHLRGMAFMRYEHRQWSPAQNQRTFSAATARFLNTDLSPSLRRQHATVIRYGRGNLLFFPLNTITVEPKDYEGLRYSSEMGGPLVDEEGQNETYRFTIPAASATAEFVQGVSAIPKLNSDNRAGYLQVPDTIRGSLTPLAQKIFQEAPTPSKKIRAVISYLHSRHKYSLNFQMEGKEPLIDFLLSEPAKGAHCEFFATSAAILLRLGGVPTRYVTGYFAHEKEAGTEYTIVRGRDAHAWAEAWIEGIGWVTVEATPGDGVPNETGSGTWERLWERMVDSWRAFRDWLSENGQTQLALGVSIVIAGFVLWALWRTQQRRRSSAPSPSFRYTAAPADLNRLGERFLRLAKRRSLPLTPYCLWSEALSPETHPTAHRFARLYEAVRYSGTTSAEEVLRVEAALVAWEQEGE